MNDYIEIGVSGLPETARFVADIFKQERHEIKPADTGAAHLPDEIHISSDISPERIMSIKSEKHFEMITAIDGGSAQILSSGNFGAGVCRAARVIYKGPEKLNTNVTSSWIIPFGENTISIIFDSLCDYVGIELEFMPEWDNRLSTARQLLEYSLFNSAAGEHPSPDLIFIDGPINPPLCLRQDVYDDLLKLCYDKSIVVVGVSKSSTLRWANNCPLVSKLMEFADEENLCDPWYVRVSELNRGCPPSATVPDIYLCNLYPGIGPVLRMDIPSIYREEIESIIAGIAETGSDPEFPGYPFPLVEAHRNARILPSQKRELMGILKNQVIDLGVEPGVFDAAFSDPHEKLNADVLSDRTRESKFIYFN